MGEDAAGSLPEAELVALGEELPVLAEGLALLLPLGLAPAEELALDAGALLAVAEAPLPSLSLFPGEAVAPDPEEDGLPLTGAELVKTGLVLVSTPL